MSRSRRSDQPSGQYARAARQTNARGKALSDAAPTSEATADHLDLQDALVDLRDRVFGLRCAIAGATIASDADRAGLLRLVEDAAEATLEVCSRAA